MPAAIQIFSDLHLEFRARLPKISKEADMIVVAGDVGTSPSTVKGFFAWARQETKAPIIYVIGNHEYYRQIFPDIAESYKSISNEIPDLYMLEHDCIVLNGIRILGGTMWSFIGDSSAHIVKYSISDYRLIKKNNGTINYTDTTKKWSKFVSWLTQELEKKFDGPTIIVTHHAPSERSVPKKFSGDLLNAAFFSDLEPLVERYQPAMWIHGHMHDAISYNIKRTMVVCNPRGYPSEYGHNGFVENLVIDLEYNGSFKDSYSNTTEEISC